MDKTPAIPYAYRDSSRTTHEGQYYSKVISNAGEQSEKILYTTAFYTNPHVALNDAEKWMIENDIPEQEL